MRFSYCPDCGAKLDRRDLGDDKNVPWCGNCSKPWFDMFPTCVITLVHNRRGEVLLLRQNYISPQYRNLVSGFMQPGENAAQAAIREVLEETGLEVKGLELVGTYWFARKGLLMIGHLAAVEDDVPLRLSAEVDGASWHSPAEALSMVHPAGSGSVSNALCDLYLRRRLEDA